MTWIKPDWPVKNNVHAAVTLRSEGFSQGEFDSFNLALHVKDNAETVLKNRAQLVTMLDLPSEPVWMEQVHGARVIRAENSVEVKKADASYTNQVGIVSAVMTADCLPVLLASHDGVEIAAIHAGWRGLLAGVIANTVSMFKSNNIIAWLGPAIGPECFEVGAEVKTAFETKSNKFSVAFAPSKEEKYLADIYQLATIDLAMHGINQVYGGGFCTVTEKQRFYSYRRDGETGRMASLIWRD